MDERSLLCQENEPAQTGKLNKTQKNVICHKIGTEYKTLARELGIEEPELENIIHDCHPSTLKEYCYQILLHWEQNMALNATQEAMKTALLAIDQQTIVSELWGNDSIEFFEQLPSQDLTDILHKIESTQLEEYRNIEMDIVPWMQGGDLPLEELYVDLEMFTTDKNGQEDKGVPMKIKEIFNVTSKNENPRRILVEADAGFGKTTLLHKIVTDWTNKKQYVFNRFRQIFLFHLRDCHKGQCFEDMIKEECTYLGIDEEKGEKCVNAFQEETLFLLDGFDELNNESKNKFKNLLQQKEFRYSTVVVTSRRGEFRIEKNVKTINPGLTGKQSKRDHVHFWNKRIVISGIAKNNRENFLKKYFKITKITETLKTFFETANKDLFRCPLLLILLATLNDEHIHRIDTQTDLYKFLSNVAAKRSLIRIRKLENNENIELFDFTHPIYRKEYGEQILRFGSLAMDHLVRDHLTFTEEELENVCGTDGIFLKLGFLNRRITFKNRKSKIYYEPLHKSFLEFFTALKLFDLVNGSDPSEEEFKDKILYLMYKNILPNESSLVYPFLAGLLNKKSSILFNAFCSPWTFTCDCFSPAFLAILNEIQNRKEIISSFIPFIPKNLIINFNFRKDHPHFHICKQLIQLFPSPLQFNTVIIAVDCYHLHIPMRAKTLQLDFTDHDFPFNLPQTYILEIECDSLYFRFHKNSKANFWHRAVTFYSNIKTNKVYFYFNNCTHLIPLLYKEIISGDWIEMNIEEVEIYTESFDPETYSLLSHLMKIEKIKKIDFIDYNLKATWGNFEKDFCFSILKYSNVACIKSNSDHWQRSIPFSRLCEIGKKWEYIWFNAMFDYSLPDSEMFCSVDKITIHDDIDLESFVFVINNSSCLSSMICDASHLFPYLLQQNINLSTLRELYLLCKINECDFSHLLILPQLHLLAVGIDSNHKYSIDQCSKFAENLSLFVNQSHLDTLDLGYLKINENILLPSILENLMKAKEIKKKNKTELSSSIEMDIKKDHDNKLSTLLIYLRPNIKSKNNWFETIFFLKQLLRHEFVKKVILYNSGFPQEIDSSFLFSFSEEGFLVSEGTDEDTTLCFFNSSADFNSFLARTVVITCNDAMLN